MWIFTVTAVMLAWEGGVMAQTNEDIARIADRYWEAKLDRNPMWATSLGDYRSLDRLDDVSDAAREQWKGLLQGLKRELRGAPAAGLSPADALTRDVLMRSLEDDVVRAELLQALAPMDPLDGPHIQLPLLLVSQPFRNRADCDAYVSRLRQAPRFFSDHISNMRMGIRAEFVSPRLIAAKCIPQIRTHIVNDATRSEFFQPVRTLQGISELDRKEFSEQLERVILQDVVPSYLQLLGFMEDEYLPRCRESVGIGFVPGGVKMYEALAGLHTTTRIPPEEMHELGQSEVRRIRGEMAKVQAELSFPGSLDDFLEHMRSDPKHRFTTGDELVRAADGFLKQAQSQMPKLFGRLPKADCVMKEVESFRAASAPVAYYNPPPEDGSRPGYYYINTYSPQDRLRFTLEALTYHEAVPGHHLQIALDQENHSLPKFRRYGSFTSYVEGWALYTEKLGYDIGGYRDPYQRFGQLTFEMWRASRLVVDTGLHMKGWTRNEAILFMGKNTSLARLDIESEIDRYISWPGQALAYKIGEIRISGLRKEAEAALGAKFDIRSFHDALLSDGAMPIELLEKRMRDWIRSRS